MRTVATILFVLILATGCTREAAHKQPAKPKIEEYPLPLETKANLNRIGTVQ